ncbi:hypothetical protein MTX20_06160 [Bradyrhizobium sp. ISRA435]|nr:hypothetical protein MTX20_06160 [Bradyrhizobium sp. ISRA435]
MAVFAIEASVTSQLLQEAEDVVQNGIGLFKMQEMPDAGHDARVHS